MDRSIKQILLVIVFYCLPIPALANIFDPPVTDLSVEYLGKIFGGSLGSINLGTNTVSNPFLGNLFQVFNGVILAVATFILSYVGTVSIINTAHQGDVMGKKWSSVWIPLRSASGLLLLAPVPGSGYSLLQVTVMWIILNGVGAADKIWSFAVDNLAQGITVSQTTKLANSNNDLLLQKGRDIGPNVLKKLLCLKVVSNNINLQMLQGSGRTLEPHFIDESNNSSGTLFFGVYDPSNPNNINDKDKSICGKIKISAAITAKDLPGLATPINQTQEQMISVEAYQTKKQSLLAMINYIKPLANEIANIAVKNDKVDVPEELLKKGILFPAANIYQNLLSGLSRQSALVKLGLGSENATAESYIKNNITKTKSLGWITAGSFYFMLAKGSELDLLSTALIPPEQEDIKLKNVTNLTKTSADSLDKVFIPYEKALNNGKIPTLFENPDNTAETKRIRFTNNPNTFILAPLLATGAIGIVVNGLVWGVQAALEMFINNVINSNDGDPLLEHAREGYKLMLAAEIIFISLAIASFVASIALGVCGAVNPGPSAISTAILTIVIPMLSILGILWGVGATLAIYTPMIPYMMFAVTSLGWLMLVVEAIVAAPVVALGLIIPGQEELGHIAPALGIIATLFLKPLLMVVGLIMGTKMFIVMISFVSFGFGEAIATLQSATNGGSIFSCVPITVLYVGFVLALENKCFALIYQLPDKILRWIGVHGESTDVSALQETKSNFDANAKKGVEPVQGMASGGMGRMQEHMQEQAKEARDAAKQSGPTELGGPDKASASENPASSGGSGNSAGKESSSAASSAKSGSGGDSGSTGGAGGGGNKNPTSV
jgi:defect in organelle trafficking protein DotA